MLAPRGYANGRKSDATADVNKGLSLVVTSLTKCEPSDVEITRSETFTSPEQNNARPCYDHGKSNQSSLSSKYYGRHDVRAVCALLLAASEDIVASLVDHVEDTDAEHKPTTVHSIVTISMQSSPINLKTYMLLRLSCLLAGSKVKVLMSEQDTTHEKTTP